MSRRSSKIVLQDILASIEKIQQYTNGLDYEGFVSRSMVVDAVVRNIEIIGEASKNMPEDTRGESPQIPWKQMAGIRNRIVHEYFGVDVSIIWFVVENELPLLKIEIENLLKDST
jgi:uncharacterized protein with HEPN domain